MRDTLENPLQVSLCKLWHVIIVLEQSVVFIYEILDYFQELSIGDAPKAILKFAVMLRSLIVVKRLVFYFGLFDQISHLMNVLNFFIE